METTNAATLADARPGPVASAPPVPLLDLKAQFAAIRGEIMRAVEAVFESQHFILGKEVQLLEEEVAAFVGVPYAVGCASGSDALYLSLCAEGIGPGDEVITSPFTFGATAGAITRTGATPVFVDIERTTFNINSSLIESSITDKTRAIIPVHLFGLAADLQSVQKLAAANRLIIVEDAAQAIGATYYGRQLGSWGEFGCFSFFPSKNLGCAGDGGLITTNSLARAERLRLLRAHGSRRKYHYEILGTNSRLDALQAAILRVKLRHLPAWEHARQQHAALYCQLIEQHKLRDFITCPLTPSHCSHVFNQFVIRCTKRDLLRAYLGNLGVATEIYYPEPLHLQPAFAFLGYRSGTMPEAEAACQETLALPIYPELQIEDQERVVRAMAEFYCSHC